MKGDSMNAICPDDVLDFWFNPTNQAFWFAEMQPEERQFMLMPLMHSDSRAIHQQAVELFARYTNEYVLDFEIKHREIIERFGRYPHRNAVLGRQSTAEELAFLQEPGSSF